MGGIRWLSRRVQGFFTKQKPSRTCADPDTGRSKADTGLQEPPASPLPAINAHYTCPVGLSFIADADNAASDALQIWQKPRPAAPPAQHQRTETWQLVIAESNEELSLVEHVSGASHDLQASGSRTQSSGIRLFAPDLPIANDLEEDDDCATLTPGEVHAAVRICSMLKVGTLSPGFGTALADVSMQNITELCRQEPGISSISAQVDAVQPAVSCATADPDAAVPQQTAPMSVVQLESATQPCSEQPLTASSCALGALCAATLSWRK